MSELENVDLTSITPDEFAALARAASDDEVRDAIHAVGTEQALTRIFQGFEERFAADRAKNTQAVVQFRIDDDGTEHPYVLEIDNGSCATRRGEADDPRVGLRLKLIDFVKLITGQKQGPMLFMGGKLKIDGDLMFASRLMNFFEVPKG